MFPLRSFIAIVIFLVTAAVFSQLPHHPLATTTNSDPEQARQTLGEDRRTTFTDPIVNALNRRVTLQFEKTPLRKALAEISKQIGIEIVLSEDRLREAGCDVDTPVTFEAKAWQAESALTEMLRGLTLEPLTWTPQYGVIVVLPVEAAEKIHHTRTFPIDELLEYERANRWYLGYEFGDPYSSDPLPDELDGEQILNSIQIVVPGPWLDIDGTGGTLDVNEQARAIVVRATWPVLREVEQHLNAMTAFTRGELQGASRVIPSRHTPRIDDAEWRRTLNQRVSFDFGKLPLNEFVDRLRTHFGRPVWLDEPALAKAGIKTTDPVHLNAKSIPLVGGLDLALSPLDLAYALDEDIVRITTGAAAGELTYTVAHDVRDFLRAEIDPQSLIHLLEYGAAGGQWIDIDGAGGVTDEPLPGLLFVRQTQSVHMEIAKILADLRQAPGVLAHRNSPDPKPEPRPVVTVALATGIKDLPSAVRVVKALVEPASWKGQGGQGEVFIIDDKLMIRGRTDVIIKIQRLLKQINIGVRPIGHGIGHSMQGVGGMKNSN